MSKLNLPFEGLGMYIYIYINMGQGQYLAQSHQFLKSVLSFFRFWYISKCYRFLKSVLLYRFPSPSSTSKKDVSNTTLH